MSRNLHTSLSFEPEVDGEGLGPFRTFQRFAAMVQRSFRFRSTAVVIVDRPEGSKVDSIPTSALLAPGAEAEFRGLSSISGGILDLAREGATLAGFEVVRRSPGKDVIDLAPWLQNLIAITIWWDHTFWSDYGDFKSAEYQKVYAGLLRSIRDEGWTARIIDGPEAIGWKEGEPSARFIYYRDPYAFARSFMELQGIEGDASRAVAVFRDLSDRGVLDQLVHERSPPLAALEAASAVTPFKRLRFTKQGGIILEEGRYGVGHDEETGESPWYHTWWPLKPVLVESLERSGVARRVAPALDAKK